MRRRDEGVGCAVGDARELGEAEGSADAARIAGERHSLVRGTTLPEPAVGTWGWKRPRIALALRDMFERFEREDHDVSSFGLQADGDADAGRGGDG